MNNLNTIIVSLIVVILGCSLAVPASAQEKNDEGADTRMGVGPKRYCTTNPDAFQATGAKHDPVLDQGCKKLDGLIAEIEELKKTKASKAEVNKLREQIAGLRRLIEAYDKAKSDAKAVKADVEDAEQKRQKLEKSSGCKEACENASKRIDALSRKVDKAHEAVDDMRRALEKLMGMEDFDPKQAADALADAKAAHEFLKDAKSIYWDLQENFERMQFDEFALEASLGLRAGSKLQASDGEVIRGKSNMLLNLRVKRRLYIESEAVDHLGFFAGGTLSLTGPLEKDVGFELGSELLFDLGHGFALGPHVGYQMRWLNLREGDNYDALQMQGFGGLTAEYELGEYLNVVGRVGGAKGYRSGMTPEGHVTEPDAASFQTGIGLQLKF